LSRCHIRAINNRIYPRSCHTSQSIRNRHQEG
jgi:hypothetical protein